jgi:hypothetical protein
VHWLTPPWLCRAFGYKAPEQRRRIIRDKKLCLFCLLNDADEVCFSKINKTRPICEVPGCKGKHIKWLHEMLKEVPREDEKNEGRVNVVQGEEGRRTLEDTWMEMEEVEEGVRQRK